MPEARPIRWLHLSDLHLGCRGEDLWWQVEEELRPSVRAMAQSLGPPDLILFSGDLTNRGAAEEFAGVDRFLDKLLGWLRDEGATVDPLILPVPGNHDLQRPQGRKAFEYRVLDRYGQGADDEDVRLVDEELWDQRKASFLNPLFKAYRAWLQRRILPELERRKVAVHRSHIPGDFWVELEIDGAFPLGLIALNSTWQQYQGGDFERRLLLPTRQFQATLPAAGGASPLEALKRCERRLLMMHHPPGWFSERGRAVFDGEIYPPGRFDLCLHGHLHKGRTETVLISGGKPRSYFQSPSLFGLEHYGTASEERLMGYAWGSLSAAGEVRIWPLVRVRRGSGEGAFEPDTSFPGASEGVLIAPWQSRPAEVPPPSRVDFRRYLEDLVDSTEYIAISGIGQAGTVKGALRHPIERLYTPLRSRAELEDLAEGDRAGLASGGQVGLQELLPRRRQLLLEGQPGAGKTTFLRFVATMLGRDGLGRACPDGSSWRRRYLGLPDEETLRVPVFLRISELASRLEKEKTGRDDRGRVLDLLAEISAACAHGIRREDWQSLVEEDGAVLLFDGLDEVADEGLRARVFEVFRDACRRWKCPVVVTSRPIETAALEEMGFHRATVEPFREPEIRQFLDHWVAALHAVAIPEDLTGEGERYRDALLSAICGFPQVRRLAANPVMLTCLCVVHWNEGQLPEGRSRVYRAVLRWLIASRTALREKEGFTDPFAWNAFARLALAMMNAEGGKRAVFDLEEAAEAIDPVVKRYFAGKLSLEGRRRKARHWLGFECLGSGIVEQVSNKRLRFWHLTFQEFLAALQLAWRDDGDNPKESWWPLVTGKLDDPQWRETIELFPGCLLDEGGLIRADRLLERVLALRGGDGDLACEARVAAIAGRLLQSLSVFQYKPQPWVSRDYEEALKRSMAIFEPEGAARVPVGIRIEVAEALGRGGDPRLAADQDNFLEVPGLGGLRLGKYPVTVEEYKRFVDDRGYEDDTFWQDAAGRSLKAEGWWGSPGNWDEQLQAPNRPVMEVSWYEAVAYCRWLSEQRGFEVRLPTEAEWQAAATPARGEFPWGEKAPDEERANFDCHVDKPTPVGIYPTGNGRYGHCDLAGNVWEWCANLYLRKDSTEDVRVLKGGGWFYDAELLLSAIRYRSPARRRFDNFGFRVAAVPARPSPPVPPLPSPPTGRERGEERSSRRRRLGGSQSRS